MFKNHLHAVIKTAFFTFILVSLGLIIVLCNLDKVLMSDLSDFYEEISEDTKSEYKRRLDEQLEVSDFAVICFILGITFFICN